MSCRIAKHGKNSWKLVDIVKKPLSSGGRGEREIIHRGLKTRLDTPIRQYFDCHIKSKIINSYPMDKAEKQTGMKRCTNCGKLKDKVEFGKDKRLKDGLRCWCKKCEQQYQSLYYLRTSKTTRRNFKYDKSHRVFGGVKQKRCRKCRRWKAESEFHKDSTNKDGIRVWCKKCANKAHRQRRLAVRN